MIPADIRRAIERAVSEAAGREIRVTRAARVGGGCISPAARVEFEARPPAFVKWAEPGRAPLDLFTREAESLSAIGAANAVRVPRVEAVAARWLLLEWIEPGRPSERGWRALGAQLAGLHRSGGERDREPGGRSGRGFGWPRDNYIGSLPQQNGRLEDWAAFWRDRRLVPQLERAYAAGHFDGSDRRRFTQLLRELETIIGGAARADGRSLVHGDLWNGNVHFAADGEPVLIDPAAYVGHREVDLAMAELFGGFSSDFFAAYGQTWPLEPDYAPRRRATYQLYYLLVHVNLFGSGYVAGARSARERALGEHRTGHTWG